METTELTEVSQQSRAYSLVCLTLQHTGFCICEVLRDFNEYL